MNQLGPKDQGSAEESANMQRWEYLASAAFRLLESLDKHDVRSHKNRSIEETALLTQMADTLDSLLEIFTKDLDPVEDLPGYAFRRFSTALRSSLDKMLNQNRI